MRKVLVFFIVLMATPVFSQEIPNEVPNFEAVDSLYREDQFYFSLAGEILLNKQEGLKQNKISTGFTFGFLRDMPINKNRTWSIAAGLGYGIYNLNQNLLVSKIDGDVSYTINDTIAFDKNKLILNYIELPIELRWRTSTPESHKFWRIYTGFKFSYLVFDRQKYKDADKDYSVSNNADLNKLRYGAYVALGYNTWNFNVYYGLNPIFKSGTVNGEAIDFKVLNIGLMFYIL